MPYDQPIAEPREDTMIYREPTSDSDDNAVQDIWGKQLEVMTVDASEVQDYLAAGWVTHPLDLGKKPEERAGFKRDAGSGEKELAETRLALDTAEKLVDEQAKRIAELETERDNAHAAEKLAIEAGDKIAADLKAAEELADAETKAKDEALAELAALKADSAASGKGTKSEKG